ncbi:MAG: hypothetical protein WC976_06590 [Caldisericia bacterium]
MKILAFDVESLRDPNVVGWSNHGAHGISVLCLCDVLSGPTDVDLMTRYFDQFENKPSYGEVPAARDLKRIWTYTDPILKHRDEIISHFESADMIVAHNSFSYDYPVLSCALSLDCTRFKKKTMDFANTIFFKHRCRVSLVNIMKRMFQRKFIKSLSGALTVPYWNSGDPAKKLQVINHCETDVLWCAYAWLGMLQDTVYEKGLPVSGRVHFINGAEMNRRQQGLPPKARILGTCLIPYPQSLRDWLSPKVTKRKQTQYTLNHEVHKLIQPSRQPELFPMAVVTSNLTMLIHQPHISGDSLSLTNVSA